MADAPEIKVKLTAEDTGVAAAIKELGNQLKGLKKNQDDAASSASGLTSAFKGLLAVIAVEKLLAFGKATLDSATAIARASQITGASTQTLGVFRKTAEDLGVSSEAVDKGFVKLSRSILAFQQGSTQAVKNFQQLGVSQKDLANLNTDQKIQLITNRLGSMADGTTKAALAQALLGRGGAELIPVLNDLAGEGFEKARASAEKFGLLLNGETATALLLAKKGLTDLADVGKGIATQFAAGLAPAITDVANALIKATTTEGVGGFRSLGEAAGSALKSILVGIVAVVAGIVEIGAKTSALVQNLGRATAEAITKGPKAAWQSFEQNELEDANRIDAEIQSREAALLAELSGNQRQQDEADQKAKAARRAKNVPEVIAIAPPSDAAARAALSFLEKQLQDEIAIRRAYAKQAEEVDKEQFDRGEITLAEYYERRRAEVKAESADEIAILKQGLATASDAFFKASDARRTAATPKDADKQKAAEIEALTKIDELNAKISEAEINSATTITQLDAQQFKAKQENQQAVLEFEKTIDTSAGKHLEAAKQEIALEKQKLEIILRQRGESEAQISEQLSRYEQIKVAEATFQDLQKQGEAQLKALDDQKAAIDEKVKRGQLFTVQAQDQIRQLEASRLPVLEQIAAQMKAQADASGREEDKAAADQFSKQVEQAAPAVTETQQQMAQLRSTLESSLTSGFAHFFETVGRGTESVARSFENLAGSVIGALAKMTAQMLAQIIVAKLLKAALGGAGGFSGGGAVPSTGGAGYAEGGLIKGPGGPKADAIPARVSSGEYIVQADAVKQFGLHNLDAINRGLKVPSFESLALPKFAEGGLVGAAGAAGASGDIRLGIGLDKGLILQHLSSKDAGRIVLQHLTNNPKAAGKALGRSQG